MSDLVTLHEDDDVTRFKIDGDEIGVNYLPDIPYENFGKQLRLQILQPSIFNQADATFPCIVFVQGSGWMKQNIYYHVADLVPLAAKGYVIAIVEYRDSTAHYHFPDPVIDTKNAIRFMRANADKYHVQKENFIVMGDSSGGQVATITGMTAQTTQFDQPINDESIAVKGIIDLYGAVNLTMDGATPFNADRHHDMSTPESLEMGFDVGKNKAKAEVANAKNYVHNSFPPILITHGTADVTVSAKVSIEFYHVLKQAHKPVEFYLIEGADHNNKAFYDERMSTIYDKFIQRCLAD